MLGKGDGWDLICWLLQKDTSTCSAISEQPQSHLSDTLAFKHLGDFLSARN